MRGKKKENESDISPQQSVARTAPITQCQSSSQHSTRRGIFEHDTGPLFIRCRVYASRSPHRLSRAARSLPALSFRATAAADNVPRKEDKKKKTNASRRAPHMSNGGKNKKKSTHKGRKGGCRNDKATTSRASDAAATTHVRRTLFSPPRRSRRERAHVFRRAIQNNCCPPSPSNKGPDQT